jgi:hypothetical protein
MKDLRGQKVQKVTATLIAVEGDFVMQITRFHFTNSFLKNYEDEEKDGIREDIEAGKMWNDPTPQILVTLGDKNGNGVVSHRLNGCGYLKNTDPEVSEDMLNGKGILVIKGYVCKENKDGKFERIESPEKTEKAMNMIHSFINKLGITDEKLSIEEAIKRATDNKYLINATIINDHYEGKDNFIIDKFSRVNLDDLEETEEPAASESDFDNENKE